MAEINVSGVAFVGAFGSGGVLRDKEGIVRALFSGHRDACDAESAELGAIITALDLFIDIGWKGSASAGMSRPKMFKAWCEQLLLKGFLGFVEFFLAFVGVCVCFWTQFIAEICINQLQMAAPATATVIVTTTIKNDAGQDLILRSSNYGPLPALIRNTETTAFLQTLPANYENGAFVYKVGESCNWIVFWTPDNKVSTKLFKDDTILWLQLANNLHPNHSGDKNFGLTAMASIEQAGATAQVLTAKICRF
ncbi:hypothetical protein J1N35_029455 [Gossypium stocksii]|uniref:RNase H type-1 domain-containing protein n=1 Tax=Gossypium stocksii TaxID=47602 RepID=A0A9D3UY28_9ROSI|nr:hypothetical protein J1N35_029455 [Gossypium stocksii]